MKNKIIAKQRLNIYVLNNATLSFATGGATI